MFDAVMLYIGAGVLSLPGIFFFAHWLDMRGQRYRGFQRFYTRRGGFGFLLIKPIALAQKITISRQHPGHDSSCWEQVGPFYVQAHAAEVLERLNFSPAFAAFIEAISVEPGQVTEVQLEPKQISLFLDSAHNGWSVSNKRPELHPLVDRVDPLIPALIKDLEGLPPPPPR